ncbi:uncharacterized protein [Haliotis asinina]
MYIGVGIGVGIGVIFAIVAVALWCRCRRRRRKSKSPLEVPKPYPPVIPETVMSTSTDFLVQNESLSADSLPIAPPPPQVELEPHPKGKFEELYENTAGEEEEGEDYLQPNSWNPASDDLYIPMDGHLNLEPPVPPSELTVEYADPSAHPPKPAACRGSKGYVNIPKSGAPPTSLAKHPKVKEEDEEEDAQEDYENVLKASTGNGVAQYNANTLPKYANLSAEEMMRASPRSLPKVPKTKVKTGQSKTVKKEQSTKVETEQTSNAKTTQLSNTRAQHTPKKVTPKVTPKVKHKQLSQDESGESSPDYVNVKQYSKKAEVSGRPDMEELKHALKLRKN